MNELKGFILSRPSQYEDRRDGGPRKLPNLSLSNAAHSLNTLVDDLGQGNYGKILNAIYIILKARI